MAAVHSHLKRDSGSRVYATSLSIVQHDFDGRRVFPGGYYDNDDTFINNYTLRKTRIG